MNPVVDIGASSELQSKRREWSRKAGRCRECPSSPRHSNSAQRPAALGATGTEMTGLMGYLVRHHRRACATELAGTGAEREPDRQAVAI